MIPESSPFPVIAILPAAGLGSRMKPTTQGMSKELLRLGGSTVLDKCFVESEAAGVGRIVIVVSPQKTDLLKAIERRSLARRHDFLAQISQVVQENPTGLAHAVAMAGTAHDALVLLPDTIFYPNNPSRRIKDALLAGADVVVAVGRIGEDQVHLYGIVDWDSSTGEIRSIVEKPRPEETISRWAIAGRFGLSRAALSRLPDLIASWTKPGEVHLPPLLDIAIKAGLRGIAIPLEDDERRFDCGSVEGYREALGVMGE